MAVALTLLIALPVLAADGTVSTTSSGTTVAAGVYANGTSLSTGASATVVTTASEDTKVGNVLWVSNGSSAFNKVYVKVIDTVATGSTITVDVKNSSTGVKLTAGGPNTHTDQKLILFESSTTDVYQGQFQVLSSTTTAVDNVIATHLHKISITHGSIVHELTVDANGPVIANPSPAHGIIQSSTSATFSAVVTDDNSGLRADNEKNPDPSGSTDTDGDGVTSAEPITVAGGAADDIAILIGDSDADNSAGGTDEISLANAGWSTTTNGFTFVFNRPNLSVGTVWWRVEATDRVGNKTVTDQGNTDTAFKDNYKIDIDNQAPKLNAVATGKTYDSGTKAEKSANNSLKLTFVNVTSLAADKIDSTTVETSDFIVKVAGVSQSVTGVIVVDNFVYVTLAADLNPDAKPTVEMLAGVLKDKAGNTNQTESVTATDGIKPTFTVTITGETGVSGRPIGETGLTVRVVANEKLTAAPAIFFANIKATTTTDTAKVSSAAQQTAPAVSGATNTWEKTFTAAEMGLGAQSTVAVIVKGTDEAANTGFTTGFTDSDSSTGPSANDVLDIVKLNDGGLLGEVDNALAAPSETLQPGTGSKTESANPFIRIDYAESGEYKTSAAGPVNTSGTVASLTANDKTVKFDSHGKVTLVSITLDGVDVSGQTARVDDDSFSVAAKGLALGKHKLEYKGKDDVGNEVSRTYEFEVIERSAYKVSLSPGWNLVSLPSNPGAPSLDSVLPSTMSANTALAYVAGEWKTAVRGTDGMWAGTLTEIVAGNGYWIQTGSFESISTLIPERDPASALPTIPVIAGWNLIGVTDLAQRAAGATTPVDTYMSSITQKVVYTYDTQASTWTKVVSGNNVVNGKGYWVWADKAGTLVP
jgi:hypothetical protein